MRNFIRNKEDFVCENCGMFVRSTGYTNHCPNCLWSKHVDNVPGDRRAECRGMMEPIRIEYDGRNYKIVHKCTKCKITKKNISAPNDNITKYLELFG